MVPGLRLPGEDQGQNTGLGHDDSSTTHTEATSCRSPRRTGQDTCRIIRLSGFLVSLTLAYWHECRDDTYGRVEYSCVFELS